MAQQVKSITFKITLGLSALCLLGALVFGVIVKAPILARVFGTACPILLAVGLSGTSSRFALSQRSWQPCAFRNVFSALET